MAVWSSGSSSSTRVNGVTMSCQQHTSDTTYTTARQVVMLLLLLQLVVIWP
jgi:hypothetical protein